jgi:hypothetical protein
MKALLCLLALVALAGGGRAYASCSHPTPPDKLPDGATATLQDMLAAQKQMKDYNDQVKAYTDCLNLEHDQAVPKGDASKMTKEQKDQKDQLDRMQAQKVNAAVDEATEVTNRFNEQVKVFKAKQKKS